MYIQLFSPHGLIRYKNPEIGRDPDTGGQVKYVLELLHTLSEHEAVRKVDLFTRRISDRRVSPTYSKTIEPVNEKARIVRVPCGGNQYRTKETLWPYLEEFVDNVIRFVKEQDEISDVVHGHYADGNYIAQQLSDIFGLPFVATGHSLGRNKRKILLESGFSPAELTKQFHLDQRIEVEETVLRTADIVIASTRHEINTHYSLYQSKNMANFVVIPPGVNTEIFYPYYRVTLPGFEMEIEQEQAYYRISEEIERFFYEPNKPIILAIGRADKRKNFERIIEAYGCDQELQAIANLAIFAGIRKDITQMSDNEREILTNLLLLLDKYDLYGKFAIPKKNDPKREIPEIYRLTAWKKGVFVSATPGENFGLTLVEASSCGLPVVASPDGGPKEIIETCQNGEFIKVEDHRHIAEVLKKLLTEQELWKQYSENGVQGVNQHFSWKSHVDRYLEQLTTLVKQKTAVELNPTPSQMAIGKRFSNIQYVVITDIDGTLISGEEENTGLQAFMDFLQSRRNDIIFGVATGRNRQLTETVIGEYDLLVPDLFICSAGTEIYYGQDMKPDKGWERHISHFWKRDQLREVLQKLPTIELQEEEAQWKFKLSYYVDEDFTDDDLAEIYHLLDTHKLKATLLLTENSFLDFLPYRASKGKAIRYLSYKWNIPLPQILTSGNSGNDADMLKGETKGIIVGNYSEELDELRKSRQIYFAEKPLAEGIMEGLEFYGVV